MEAHGEAAAAYIRKAPVEAEVRHAGWEVLGPGRLDRPGPPVFRVKLPGALAPAQSQGAPRKDARDYAVAVTVDLLLEHRPARLLAILELDASRTSPEAAQFYRILRRGRRLLGGRTALLQDARLISVFVVRYRSEGDTLALLSVLAPYLAEVPGVELSALEICNRLARLLAPAH